MYQMATVSYHTLHGTQTVVLEEDFTAPDGTVYTAGTPYDIDVEGRYWADFDRENPIDAAVRAQAWTGVAHALIGELGVGTVTAQALQLGLALAGLFAGLGATLVITGGGLVLGDSPRSGSRSGPQAGSAHRLSRIHPYPGEGPGHTAGSFAVPRRPRDRRHS